MRRQLSILLLKREEIAAGGTALIYRLTYSSGDEEIEKILLPKFQSNPDYERLQEKEYGILFSLQHPLIVRAIRLQKRRLRNGSQTSDLFLECVQGKPLSALMSFVKALEPAIRENWAHRLLGQLISVLRYLRFHEIVHGDIAPDNVMVQPNGMVKLLDFGVARKAREEAFHFHVAGRPYFKAPELRECGGTSLEGDVFAVGRIFEDVLGDDLARTPKNKVLLQSLLEGRLLPRFELAESGWSSALSPLPSGEHMNQEGVVRKRTLVSPRKTFFSVKQNLYAICLLFCFPILTSWLPQKATLTVNTLPYSSFTVDVLGSQLRFETPVQSISLPSGMVRLDFVIPSQNNRHVVKVFRVHPSDELKVFEDFRNLDTFRR